MNVGIMLPNWLGDVTMATPALCALRRHFAGARIAGIMRPYVSQVLTGSDWLDEEIFYDAHADDPALHTRALVERLRRERFDMLILLRSSFRAVVAAWRGRARRRVGYGHQFRSLFLTDPIPLPRDGAKRAVESTVEHYLRIVRYLGCEIASPRLELFVTEPERRHARDVWRRLGIEPSEPIIALNTGGAYGSTKHWPVRHAAETARRLADRDGRWVLVMCGPAERETARQIAEAADHPRVKSLADIESGIGLAKGLIADCRLMISTDSGPRHFATALGLPVVALMGPIDPRLSQAPEAREIVLSLDLECHPCGKRVCPLEHHRCMEDLLPDQVVAAAETLLSGQVERN